MDTDTASVMIERVAIDVTCVGCRQPARWCRCSDGPIVKLEEIERALVGVPMAYGCPFDGCDCEL